MASGGELPDDFFYDLKSFEREPPIAMTTIRGDRLQAAQSQAATESKLFGALGKQKD